MGCLIQFRASWPYEHFVSPSALVAVILCLNPKKQSGQTRRKEEHHAEDDEDGHDHPHIIEDFFGFAVEKE